ncbi:hypothetical protein C8F04DRAFT_1310460 [Mycena alexandri]|uniref:Uncharacterized protein n=1 Tax=Mycena alexandri TaxID=1745969 RepID=A0AAD6WRL2_9AGAR|nr:hypothetical protein C8F04DRAFT_1310460 [Mycena alexandri]
MEQRRRGDVQRLTQGVRAMRLVHERTTDLVALTARLVDARGNNADAVVLSAGCLVVHISRLYAARPRHIGRLRHAQGKMCVHCICIAPPSVRLRTLFFLPAPTRAHGCGGAARHSGRTTRPSGRCAARVHAGRVDVGCGVRADFFPFLSSRPRTQNRDALVFSPRSLPFPSLCFLCHTLVLGWRVSGIGGLEIVLVVVAALALGVGTLVGGLVVGAIEAA